MQGDALHVPELGTTSGKGFRDVGRWLLASSVVGVACGLVAVLYYYLLEKSTELFSHKLAGFYPPNPSGESHVPESALTPEPSLWWIFVPTLGGLIAGFLIFFLSPEAQRSGTDKVIDAFHRFRGVLGAKVPIVKGLSAIAVIGSGGSVGREGPIVLLGASAGQGLHRLIKKLGLDRRTLLLAGAAGGFASIFRAPLAGAVFAIEVLYRNPDFEYEAFLPCLISSIVSYTTFGIFYGWKPIFAVPPYSLENPIELVFFASFGVVCAVAGIIYVKTLYELRGNFFDRLPVKPILLPALGGLMLGGLIYFCPQVWGTGYGWVQHAIDGKFIEPGKEWSGLLFILGLAAAKCLATGITFGSRGGEGVFGPTFFVGGMVGAAFGGLMQLWFPTITLNPASYVLIGMGGVFAGVTKVPIAGLLMVSEISGSYSLLLPMILVSSIAYLLTGKFSVYRSQLASRADSPVHRGDFVRDVLDGVTVKDVWSKTSGPVETIHRDTPLKAILATLTKSHSSYFPVVDSDGKMIGILSLHDVRQVLYEDQAGSLIIAEDLATTNVITVAPDEPLNEVLRKFANVEADDLPVVDSDDAGVVLGFVSRQSVLDVYNKRLRKFLIKAES